MKRSLVLAMALAMGVSATALAANPFSDVPAGHWAYGSIAKLAAAGVVDGYGDGTYRGDRLMTRYEMAQIVARAMAKGANVDRLASEFADELDSLGVRIAKLEKKSDNVRITGEMRYNYQDTTIKGKFIDLEGAIGVGAPTDGKVPKMIIIKKDREDHRYNQGLRSRIWLTGTVNDNWEYVAMLQNIQDLTDNAGNETTNFQRAYLQGRLGGTHVLAGRQDFTLVDGNLYDNRMDGVKVQYGKKVKLNAYYGIPTDQDGAFDYHKFWGANVSGDVGKLNLTAGYDKFTNEEGFFSRRGMQDNGIWNVGAKYDFNGKASLGAIYMKSNISADETIFDGADTKGWIVTGTIMGATPSKPGSWGLWAKYYNQGLGTVVAHTMNGYYHDYGFKGWGAGVDYTLAKNMVASLQYYDLTAKNQSQTLPVELNSLKTWWTQLNITF